MTESKGTTTTTSTDPDAISWLRSTLHSVDQRCTNLQSDLKKAQQVKKISTQQSTRIGRKNYDSMYALIKHKAQINEIVFLFLRTV